MEKIETNTPKVDVLNRRSRVFDRLDKLPDISLKDLYYVLKASRKKLKQRLSIENIENE